MINNKEANPVRLRLPSPKPFQIDLELGDILGTSNALDLDLFTLRDWCQAIHLEACMKQIAEGCKVCFRSGIKFHSAGVIFDLGWSLIESLAPFLLGIFYEYYSVHIVV